jgi:hypothetical protein
LSDDNNAARRFRFRETRRFRTVTFRTANSNRAREDTGGGKRLSQPQHGARNAS